MPNTQRAATEPAYHAVSVWRHFCTARIRILFFCVKLDLLPAKVIH
jgi:hypothetical protein